MAEAITFKCKTDDFIAESLSLLTHQAKGLVSNPGLRAGRILSARLNGRREQKFSVVCRGIGKISSGGVCRRNGATAIPRPTSPGPPRIEGKGPSVDCQRCGYAAPTTRGPERPPAWRASLRDRRTFSCAHIVPWLTKIKPGLTRAFLRGAS